MRSPRHQRKRTLSAKDALGRPTLGDNMFDLAGRVASLRELWQQQQFLPLISQTTLAELIRALGYPKFRLTLAEQEELLADYLPFCTTIAIPNPPPPVPVCRDPADVPFLQLAVAGQADSLVTGDQDLLALGEECDFSILTANQLQQALST